MVSLSEFFIAKSDNLDTFSLTGLNNRDFEIVKI